MMITKKKIMTTTFALLLIAFAFASTSFAYADSTSRTCDRDHTHMCNGDSTSTVTATVTQFDVAPINLAYWAPTIVVTSTSPSVSGSSIVSGYIEYQVGPIPTTSLSYRLNDGQSIPLQLSAQSIWVNGYPTFNILNFTATVSGLRPGMNLLIFDSSCVQCGTTSFSVNRAIFA
jgi:hypothetical protein